MLFSGTYSQEFVLRIMLLKKPVQVRIRWMAEVVELYRSIMKLIKYAMINQLCRCFPLIVHEIQAIYSLQYFSYCPWDFLSYQYCVRGDHQTCNNECVCVGGLVLIYIKFNLIYNLRREYFAIYFLLETASAQHFTHDAYIKPYNHGMRCPLV